MVLNERMNTYAEMADSCITKASLLDRSLATIMDLLLYSCYVLFSPNHNNIDDIVLWKKAMHLERLEIILLHNMYCNFDYSKVPNKHPWTDIVFWKKNPPLTALLGPRCLLNFDFFLVQVPPKSIIIGFLLQRAWHQLTILP